MPRQLDSRRPTVAIAARVLLASALLAGVSDRAVAQAPAATITENKPDLADIRQLSQLLSKPAVRSWLTTQAGQSVQDAPAAPTPASVTRCVSQGLDAARSHLHRLAAGISALPLELRTVRTTLASEVRAFGLLPLLGPLVLFGILGTLSEQVFWHLSAALRRQLIAFPIDTVNQRLAAAGWRTLYGLSMLASFTAGSLGAFLALQWPPLLQEIVLTYLSVFLAVRLTLVVGRIVLAPSAERFRMLPMTTTSSRYWFIWSAVLVGAFYFIQGTFRLVPVLGGTPTTQTLFGVAMNLVNLALALATVWRRPTHDGKPGHHAGDAATWLVSIWLVGVWLSAFAGETAPVDIGLILLLVALAALGLRSAVNHLLRPSADSPESAAPPIAVTAVERGLRIILVLAAAIMIARSLGLDLTVLAVADATSTRIVRGALNVVVIGLAADFVWQVVRAWIDTRVDVASAAGASGSEEEQRHRQRLRTLLPIMRNLVIIVLLVVVGLMALSSLGVEIRPLIAGAGVVGIAVGFGAQTLVKDVISGLFFLFDDAFRVGEYIESGRIKGTVEAFSLRSIKLRHHRGPLHTVPFGALSTITNYSRDWVIDKITLGLAYNTDLEHVRRVVKAVGRELQADPEFAPSILEPLKMQGVSAFGDFAIQVRVKMMTRPGEQQYAIRHRAHALIKEAFNAEGIQFAYPTVSIAGNGGAIATAAAQTSLQRAVATSQDGSP